MRKDRLVSEVLGEEAVLAPSDLYNKEFRRVLVGGYDATEVDAFLERVADALEPLIRQVRDLKQQQEQNRATIEEYRQMEATLRSALVTSQKFGENLVESARREAEHLVAAARIEKSRLELETAKLPAELTKEIARLEEQRNRLRADILAILETHKSLLEATLPAEETIQSSFESAPAAAPTSAESVPAAPGIFADAFAPTVMLNSATSDVGTIGSVDTTDSDDPADPVEGDPQ